MRGITNKGPRRKGGAKPPGRKRASDREEGARRGSQIRVPKGVRTEVHVDPDPRRPRTSREEARGRGWRTDQVARKRDSGRILSIEREEAERRARLEQGQVVGMDVGKVDPAATPDLASIPPTKS